MKHRNPFLTAWSLHWLLVLALLWVPLAASAVVQKTASGDFLAWRGTSGEQPLLEAAPCLGFEDSNGENASGICVAENNYLKHTELAKKQQQLAECKDDACRKQVNSYWAQLSQDRNTKTGDSIITGSEAANLQTMDRLATDMSNLAQYKSGLESQLSATSDPNQRASIQLQINEADNNIRQIASQGKDALALLYQQTGNPEYQNAFQALVASTGGNELSAAWGAGGVAGMSNKRVPKEVDGAATGAKEGAAAPNAFATNSGEAVFWSGKTNGVGGADAAGCIASACGGTTLEQLMANKGITLPAWDASNPATVAAWQNASKSFAQGASGDVNAVLGSTLRPGSVWETVELPALKANPNVTSITTIDPATGVKTIIWKRSTK